MRVALIRGDELNRFETQAYECLGPLGIDVIAIASRKPRHQLQGLRLEIVGLSQWNHHLPSRAQSLVRRIADDRLDRLLGLEQAVRSCHVLHAAETFLPFSEQAARLVEQDRRPLVLTCWENIPFRHDENQRLSARKSFVRHHTTQFLAVTPEAAMALEMEGVKQDRIAVVPPAIDRHSFRPREATGQFRLRWRIPQGVPIALAIGRLIDEKGGIDLLRALQECRTAYGHDLVLVLMGRGPLRAKLLHVADALGVASAVRIADFTSYDELPDAYATADVVVLASRPTPYWEEQFGMVLLEAMACGRPIVTTRSGSIPSVVGSSAAIVSPYTPSDIAASIDRILRDSGYAQSLVQMGLERVATRHDPHHIANTLADIYRAMAAKGEASTP